MSKDDILSFGAWVKQRRRVLRLTCEELARQVGCATVTIRKIESDERRPSNQVAELLAEHLGIPAAQRSAFIRAARADLATYRLPQPSGRPDMAPDAALSAMDESRRSNLPAQATALIGRAQEITAVHAMLERPDVKLLTFAGPGGVGKTRLVFQVAAELTPTAPDGVFAVMLAAISDPDQVIPTIAQTLGLWATSPLPPLALLTEYLADKRMVLVLDNFEHVMAAAPQVAELLAAAPHLRVLVTSRAALRLYGEQVFVVPPLRIPEQTRDAEALARCDAVQLFAERARAVDGNFALTTANTVEVAEICRQLDGLPLAIELAAARVRLLTPSALLERLQPRLALLTNGPRNLPPRQRTLRNTIDWSYQLLTDDEQALFARLAVFVGGCTLAAVEAVCSNDAERAGAAEARLDHSAQRSVLDTLESLLDNNLVHIEAGVGDEPRVMILETIREYAAERLLARDDRDTMWQRHAAFFSMLAKEAQPLLNQAEQIAWFDQLDSEHGNLRAALDWTLEQPDLTHALVLGEALVRFWRVRGHLNDERRWLDTLLTRRDELTSFTLIKLLRQAGALDRTRNAYPQACVHLEASLLLSRKVDDRWGMALALAELGHCAWEQGQHEQAVALLEESLTLRRQSRNIHFIAVGLVELAGVVRDLGEMARARALLEESLQIRRRLADARGTTHTLLELARVVHDQGDTPHAIELLEQGISLTQRVGNVRGYAHALNVLADIVADCGEYDRAIALLDQALALRHQLRYKRAIAYSLMSRARVMQLRDATAEAIADYVESIRLFRELGEPSGAVRGLEGLAWVLVAQRQAEQAAQLLGTADALRTMLHAGMLRAQRAEYERTMAAVRAALDEPTFQAALNAGRTHSVAQAIAALHIILTAPSPRPLGCKSISRQDATSDLLDDKLAAS